MTKAEVSDHLGLTATPRDLDYERQDPVNVAHTSFGGRSSRPSTGVDRRHGLAQPANPTVGVVLKAVEALQDQNTQHFTRAQVAYLIALAYQTGRAHAAGEDMAETVACWAEFAEPRKTRDQRVQQRLDDMAAGVWRQAQMPDSGHRLDVEWPAVSKPGSNGLRVAA